MGEEAVYDWSPLDVEAEIAFLQMEAKQQNTVLEEDAARYIAENFRSSTGALKVALIRLIAHSSLSGTPLNLDHTKRILGKLVDWQASKVTIDPLQGTYPGQNKERQATSPRKQYVEVDCSLIFSLMKTGEGQEITKVRQQFEVNMREFERERLARLDMHERASEIRAKKTKMSMKF
jgi:hypothetical protein